MSSDGKQFEAVVRTLYLKPHPEGGGYRKTGRAAAAGAAIYYALPMGQRSGLAPGRRR